MLGCSQFHANTDPSTESKQPLSTISVKENTQNTSSVDLENKRYTINELNQQVINVKNEQVVNAAPKKKSAMLNVVLIKQNPELKYRL